MNCEHHNFQADCKVNRITDVEEGPVMSYSMDIKVRCTDCDEPFVFLGMSMGLSPAQPMMSADHQEARIPIEPASLFVKPTMMLTPYHDTPQT